MWRPSLRGFVDLLLEREAAPTPLDEVRKLREELIAEVCDVDARLGPRLHPILDAIERGRVRPPVLPAVALELLELARDPNCNYDKLARLAVTDPVVAARLMKLASSALLGGLVAPKGVKEALVRVGLDGVRQVAIDLALSSKHVADGPLLPLAERTVRHARTASALCRLLARDVGEHPGSAALAGLLHALGGVVLIQELTRPSSLAAQKRNDPPLPGFVVYLCIRRLHPIVSAQVAGHFRLDPRIVRAVERHHHVENDDDNLTRLLMFADLVSPSEPAARVIPLEEAIERSGLPVAAQCVRDRLLPITTTVDEMRLSA